MPNSQPHSSLGQNRHSKTEIENRLRALISAIAATGYDPINRLLPPDPRAARQARQALQNLRQYLNKIDPLPSSTTPPPTNFSTQTSPTPQLIEIARRLLQ